MTFSVFTAEVSGRVGLTERSMQKYVRRREGGWEVGEEVNGVLSIWQKYFKSLDDTLLNCALK